MATDPLRRRLLAAVPAAGLLLAAPPLRAAVAQSAPRLLTCWSDSAERPSAFHAGRPHAASSALALPARGHDIAWHPASDGSAVVAARRPGSFLVRWHVASGRELARFDADDDIRFEGHFAFSRDARLLFATATDLDSGDGRLGVHDARTLEQIALWEVGGIGPHAVALLADGRLAVANGGILTLPETGRVKRNLDSMDPSLALLDPAGGRLLSQHRLPDAFMSVRHVAQAADGTVGVALQNEGREPRPLFALLDGERLRYGEADDALLAACGTYAGDVAAVGGGFAVSCTRAGVTALWARDGRPLAVLPTPRVCALLPEGDVLLATGDGGDVWRVAPAGGGAPTLARWHFGVALDNHADAGRG
ncbi:DUF1513 domain-containing protein [Thauera sinica]|uniref:DUF1513 domain-containing protein n=1 Tax=Thauera sinica TaxID=2665146 RepID=A0ABW1AX32_9RHOO|nr:DUF1513 domain-containing protein [Thauera sp. K11]ATE61091.1 hypothetical protein CCZ27_15125 [Thauera sp. K11]